MTIERARTVARVQGHRYCAGWKRVARDGTGRDGLVPGTRHGLEML